MIVKAVKIIAVTNNIRTKIVLLNFSPLVINVRPKSNARHHPPRTQMRYGQALRMKAALFAVGCRPLLDCAVRESSFFPELPRADNCTMVAAALLAIHVVPMMLRLDGFAIIAL